MSKKKLGRVAVTDEREMFSRPGVARSKNKRLLEQAWYEAYKLRGSDDDEGALRAFQRCVELSGDDDSAVVSAAQNNMGELYGSLGNNRMARKWHKDTEWTIVAPLLPKMIVDQDAASTRDSLRGRRPG